MFRGIFQANVCRATLRRAIQPIILSFMAQLSSGPKRAKRVPCLIVKQFQQQHPREKVLKGGKSAKMATKHGGLNATH